MSAYNVSIQMGDIMLPLEACPVMFSKYLYAIYLSIVSRLLDVS